VQLGRGIALLLSSRFCRSLEAPRIRRCFRECFVELQGGKERSHLQCFDMEEISRRGRKMHFTSTQTASFGHRSPVRGETVPGAGAQRPGWFLGATNPGETSLQQRFCPPPPALARWPCPRWTPPPLAPRQGARAALAMQSLVAHPWGRYTSSMPSRSGGSRAARGLGTP